MVHFSYMGSLAMILQNIFPDEFIDPVVIFALVYKLGHFFPCKKDGAKRLSEKKGQKIPQLP